MGFFVTTKVITSDIIEIPVEGKFGTCAAVVIAHGDVLVGVDMQQAKFEFVDHKACTAGIVLSPPESKSPRLDHDGTRVYNIKSTGMWYFFPDQGKEDWAVDKAMQEGQRRVEASAAEPGIIAASKKQAEQVLGCMFNEVGWKVTVRWADIVSDNSKH